MNKLMTGLILVGLLIFTGCSSQGPPLATNPEDIVGIFAVNPGNTVLRLEADGTIVAAPSLTLAKNPVADPGIFRFEGDHMMLEEGKLRFVVIEDDCQHRVNVFQGMINEETGQPRNVWSPTE
jgi:hypothetical protein